MRDRHRWVEVWKPSLHKDAISILFNESVKLLARLRQPRKRSRSLYVRDDLRYKFWGQGKQRYVVLFTFDSHRR